MYNYETIIENEIQSYRQEAIDNISKFVKPSLVEQFAKILHYSWQEGLLEAEILSEDLYLYPIHFSALYGTTSEFEGLLIKELEMKMENYA